MLYVSNYFKAQILFPLKNFGDILLRTVQSICHTLLGKVLFFHIGKQQHGYVLGIL